MPTKFWEYAPPGYRLRSEIERLKRRRNIFMPGDEEMPPEEPPINPIEADIEGPGIDIGLGPDEEISYDPVSQRMVRRLKAPPPTPFWQKLGQAAQTSQDVVKGLGQLGIQAAQGAQDIFAPARGFLTRGYPTKGEQEQAGRRLVESGEQARGFLSFKPGETGLPPEVEAVMLLPGTGLTMGVGQAARLAATTARNVVPGAVTSGVGAYKGSRLASEAGGMKLPKIPKAKLVKAPQGPAPGGGLWAKMLKAAKEEGLDAEQIEELKYAFREQDLIRLENLTGEQGPLSAWLKEAEQYWQETGFKKYQAEIALEKAKAPPPAPKVAPAAEAVAPVAKSPGVQHWLNMDNTLPVAESLDKIDNAGLLELVEGHSRPGGIQPFLVKVKNPETGKSNFLVRPSSLKAFAEKHGKLNQAPKPAEAVAPGAKGAPVIASEEKLQQFTINRDPINAARQLGYEVHKLSPKDPVGKGFYADGYRYRLYKHIEGQPLAADTILARSEKEIGDYLLRQRTAPVPKPAGAVAPTAKQPWEMTRAEWFAFEKQKFKEVFPKSTKADFYTHGGLSSTDYIHRKAVRDALSEGKLSIEDYNRLHAKDYGPIEQSAPDLAAKASPLPLWTTRNEVTAAYKGQINGRIVAEGKAGPAAYLDYQQAGDRVLIANILVEPSSRRLGIATDLVNSLKKEFPDKRIEWGMLTDDGAKLKAAIEGKTPAETLAPKPAQAPQGIISTPQQPQVIIVRQEPSPFGKGTVWRAYDEQGNTLRLGAETLPELKERVSAGYKVAEFRTAQPLIEMPIGIGQEIPKPVVNLAPPGAESAAVKGAIEPAVPAGQAGATQGERFETVYRGEGGTSETGGKYWSPSQDWAAQFTQTGRLEEVKSAYIRTRDIYSAPELPYAGDSDAIETAVKEARSKGFKALRLSEGQREPSSVFVFDKTALKSIRQVPPMEPIPPTKVAPGEAARTPSTAVSPIKATPTGKGVGGIPPLPPGLVPTGPAPAVTPKGVQDALDAMGAIVQRLAPGRTTKIIDTIPGLKQTQRWLFNKSLGVREQVMKGFLGLNHVGAMESSQLQAKLLPNLRQLEDSFGKGTVSGVSDAARYIGTDAERVPFSGKLLDVVERPNLYDLTPEQQTLLMNIQADKSATLAEIKTRYGFTLNEYPTPEGSVHVPHSDISKDAMARAKARRGQETTITQQSTEPRPYVTAAERWLHDRALFDQGKITADQVFKPNLNVGELLNADNNLLASLSSHEVFKTSLAGKTKLQLYQELHPGKIPDAKILDEFNPRGYVFVEGGGLNLYYETQDAEQIIRMLKRSNNPVLRFIDNMRATAFGGDLSPATIQGFNAWMMDPVGVSKTLGSEMKSAAQARNLFNAWTLDAVAKDVRDNPEKWKRVSLYTGIDPMGGIHGVASFNREEFGTGFLSKIPKVGKYWEKFNDGMYRPVSKTMGDGFQSIYQAGLNAGLTREQAGAIAADDLMRLMMRYDYVRLGLSQAEAAHRRALLTSVSFLVQPVALMSDAAKGILKIGAFQKVTPVELYAVKRVLTLSAMATAASVSTAVLYAKNHGLDPEKAAIKAANPVNWAFTNPKNGDRYAIGGPFRSIMRAVAPGDVPGVPYPVPFAGIGRYAKSKLHPAISTGFNLKENQDYFGRQIMTGDFPVNVLQGLEYAGASALPLTGGVAVKGAMAGASPEYIAKQTASQFAGVNMSEDTNAKLQAEAIRQGKLTLQPGESIQDYPKIKADIENTPEGRAIIERSKRLTPLEQLSRSRSDRMAENDKALGEWTGTGWSNGQRPDPAKPGQMILYTINDWKKDLSEIYKEAATEWATRERIVGEFKGKEPKDEKGKARWDYYKIADRFKEKDKDGKPIPNGKIQDMDGFIRAQDEYLAGLSPDLEKYVLSQVGIHDSPLATEFRIDKRHLRDYFNRDEILSKAWEKTYHYNPEHYLTLAKIARKRGTAQGLADAQAYEQTYRLKDYERFKVQKTQKYLEANPQVDMLVWKWGYRDNPVNPTERQRMGLQPLPGQGIISPKTSSGIGKIPSKIGAR